MGLSGKLAIMTTRLSHPNLRRVNSLTVVVRVMTVMVLVLTGVGCSTYCRLSQIKQNIQRSYGFINGMGFGSGLIGDNATNVTSLTYEFGYDDNSLKVIKCLPNITNLYLVSADKITSRGIGYITHSNSLRYLCIGGKTFNCKEIRMLSKMSKLDVLYIDGGQIDKACIMELANMSGLKELVLNNVGISENTCNSLTTSLSGTNVNCD
jgi:hypothetical protein